MLHLAASVFAWPLVVSCLVFDATHAQTKPSNKINTGTVSGRVTVKGKGMPGIVVGLRPGGVYQRSKALLKGTTDEDGKYRITNVLPGAYQVAPIAPLFVFVDSSNSGSRGKALLLAEGEVVEGFDFALVPGGVITGRVTDDEGRPIVDEYVHLEITNPSSSLPPEWGNLQTDDRGIYRGFGLPPGQYRVSAGAGDDAVHSAGRAQPVYRRTFYPATTDPAQATLVEVAEATEATNIDIVTARMDKGLSASGRVVDSRSGEPVANVRLIIANTVVDGTSTHSSSGLLQSTNMKGEFRAVGLTPGKYAVSIYPERQSFSGDPVTFDVLDQDITGLLIKTYAGASLDGIVVVEGSSQNSSLQKFGPLIVSALVRDDSHQQLTPTHSAVSPDGRFHIVGVQPGTIQLSLVAAANYRGRAMLVARIERDGIVQPDGIQIQKGEQVTGLRVITAYSTGAIRGQVKIENGPLQSDARLFVDLVKAGEQSNILSPEVDARGHFMADGLTSGSYEIRATVYAPRSGQVRPSSKQLVTVTDGVVSEVTITVDLNQNPKSTP